MSTRPTLDEAPAQPTDDWPVEGPEDDDSEAPLLKSARLTRILLIAAAAIAVILIAEAAWAVVSEVTEDDPPKPAPAAEGSIAVPEGRPVQPTQLAWQEGVEAAAKAAQKIVGRTFQNYDKEVEEATGLMTPDFAEEYRRDHGRRPRGVRRAEDDGGGPGGRPGRGARQRHRAAGAALPRLTTSSAARATTRRRRVRRTARCSRWCNTDDGWLVDGIDTQ